MSSWKEKLEAESILKAAQREKDKEEEKANERAEYQGTFGELPGQRKKASMRPRRVAAERVEEGMEPHLEGTSAASAASADGGALESDYVGMMLSARVALNTLHTAPPARALDTHNGSGHETEVPVAVQQATHGDPPGDVKGQSDTASHDPEDA